jgi:hypothetical protein
MKNIHVLPTDKPSRLHLWFDKLELSKDFLEVKRNKQNIYITSNEEIKEGDWLFDLDIKRIVKADSLKVDTSKSYGCWYYKKITLTTDQDLIGVQAIDDKFLEWFVKNSSCEKVEVDYGFFTPSGRQVDPMGILQNHSQCVWKYKIIIPKEEQKQHLIDMMKDDEELGLYEEPKQENCCTPIGQIKRYIDCKGCSKKPKQETLEEVLLKKAEADNRIDLNAYANGLDDGAKWQQERMYSEEDVLEILHNYRNNFELYRNIQVLPTMFFEWFEQFKKEIK